MLNLLPALLLLLVNGPIAPDRESVGMDRALVHQALHRSVQRGVSAADLIATSLALAAALDPAGPAVGLPGPTSRPAAIVPAPPVLHAGYDRNAPSRAGPFSA